MIMANVHPGGDWRRIVTVGEPQKATKNENVGHHFLVA
jgi:hypothetical protein